MSNTNQRRHADNGQALLGDKVMLAAIVVSGILFAGLRVGGEKLQISTDTPIHIGVMLQGAILLFALGGEAFRRYKIRVVRVRAVTT